MPCGNMVLLLLTCSAAGAFAESAVSTIDFVDSAVMNDELIATKDAEKGSNSGELSDFWHLLPHDMQHSLTGVFERYSDPNGTLENPEVNAMVSALLHDELEDRAMETHNAAEEERAAEKTREAKEKEAAKAREAERQAAREKRESELDASRAAHHKEMEAARAEFQAQKERAKAEVEEHHRAHEAMMQRNRKHLEESKRRHEASKAKHAKQWERMAGLLQRVHENLEESTDNWRDAPFWDDFFHNTSTAVHWKQLAFANLEPALRAAPVLPEHRVLVLEPGQAGLAGRIAESIRQQEVQQALAHAYGTEGDESHDVVVEMGLLDAMAMGGEGGSASRLEALRKAATRLASLVKPGGTWVSISAVPPALRVPLLGRLAGSTFAVPSEKGDPESGTHTMIIRAQPAVMTKQEKSGLRGSQVANMLLYGSSDAHVWAYRLRRSKDAVVKSDHVTEPSVDGLLDMIRQQRPGKVEEL